jgi:hypothetical protein
VGGRLIKLDANGVITYCSPVLQGLWDCSLGQIPTPVQIQTLTDLLTKALEMAAGMRKCTPLLDHLLTREAANTWQPPKEPVLVSFSGGVADCIETTYPARTFGDIGPELGQAIAQSRLCQRAYRLGSETIQATVIGAGCHSAQLSGSTVFHRSITFPLQNLPVIPFTFAELLDENDPFDKPHLDFYKTYIANLNPLGEKYSLTELSPEDLKVVCGKGVEKATVFLTGKPSSLAELEACNVGSNYPLSDVFVRVKGADGSVMLENVCRVKGNSTRVVAMNSQMSNAKTDAAGNRSSIMTGVAGAVAKGGSLEVAVRISTGETLLLEGLNL